MSLSSALLNNLVIHLHLLPDKYVSSSLLLPYKDPGLQVSPQRIPTASLSQTVPCLRNSSPAMSSPCAPAWTLAQRPSTLLPPTSLSQQVLLSFSHGWNILMEIARHALFVSPSPCCTVSSVHINSHGEAFFKHGTGVFKGGCLRSHLFVLVNFLYPLNQYHGIMVWKEFLLQPQSSY